LGVDIIPSKTCTLDCIYCQVGRTMCKAIERKEYVAPDEILDELKEVLKSGIRIDYITLSGNGEPTLNSKLGEIIKGIKGISSLPVAVITNGTLLTDRNVREELLSADLVMPSLDAATQKTFQKIDRPHPSLKIENIIEGMVEFRKIYPIRSPAKDTMAGSPNIKSGLTSNGASGQIWLEIMLVEGINDNQDELNALKTAVEKIEPDKVQLNTPVRPTCEKGLQVLSAKELLAIKEFFGNKCEVIPELSRKEHEKHIKHIKGNPVRPR